MFIVEQLREHHLDYEGDLQDYLNSNPHPGYSLFQIISVTVGQFGFQHYVAIWKAVDVAWVSNSGG